MTLLPPWCLKHFHLKPYSMVQGNPTINCLSGLICLQNCKSVHLSARGQKTLLTFKWQFKYILLHKTYTSYGIQYKLFLNVLRCRCGSTQPLNQRRRSELDCAEPCAGGHGPLTCGGSSNLVQQVYRITEQATGTFHFSKIVVKNLLKKR